MANVQKFQQHALGHMCMHFERGLDANGNPIRYGNQSIDLAKSHLNYNLAPDRSSQYGFILDRCKEVYCLKRKDVNLMCSCCVTAPKDLDPADHERFFRATYDFLAHRYGGQNGKNIVSAYVHMDETTPHLHFAFVPVCWDKQNNRWTVSAKKVVNRQDLKTLHPDLERYVSRALGRDVHVMTGELSDRPNLTLPQYRTYKETCRQVDRAAEELQRAKKTLQSVESAIKDATRRLEVLNAEYGVKNAYMTSLASTQEPVDEGVREKRSFLSKETTVEMSKERWDAMKQTYMDKQASRAMHDEAIELIQKLRELVREVVSLENSNREMQQAIDAVKEYFRQDPAAYEAFLASLERREQPERDTRTYQPDLENDDFSR